MLDLRTKISIFIKEAIKGKLYIIIKYPARAQLIRDIYNKYNKIFIKVYIILKAIIYINIIIEVGFSYLVI